MKRKRFFILIAVLSALTIATTACASLSGDTDTQVQSTTAADTEESAASSDEGTSDKSDDDTGTSDGSSDSALMVDVSSFDIDDQFTDRDLSGSYDEDGAVSITLSADSAGTDGEGVTIEGSTITITEGGVYIISGALDDGEIIVSAPDDDKVQLVLDNVDIHNEDGPAILVKTADKVFITLKNGSDNTLSDGGGAYTQESDVDSTIDGVIFSKSDLTIQGSGSLAINAQYKNGIVSKDDLVLTGGELYITASGKGLQANDSIRIADGTIDIGAEDDAVHTDKADKEGKGYIYIAGGTLTLDSGDDAIHAETALIINGGTIDVTSSYEGLEGSTIDILDGDISVTASDDGLNATSTITEESSGTLQQTAARGPQGGRGMGGMMGDVDENAYICISGGTVYVNAGGDGLDSNGNLYIEGGAVYVDGPTDNGNGALDTGSGAQITGGTLVAAGSAGMAVGFDDDSTQYSILYIFSDMQDAGTEITLTDSAGKVILSYTPSKQYQSVVLSSEDLKEGEYTITAGDTTDTITVDSISVRAGSSSSMRRGGFGSGFGRGRMQDSPPANDDDKDDDDSADDHESVSSEASESGSSQNVL